MKLSGDYIITEIIEIHQIKSRLKIKRLMKWYRDGEKKYLAKNIGRSKSSPTELSEVEDQRRI